MHVKKAAIWVAKSNSFFNWRPRYNDGKSMWLALINLLISLQVGDYLISLEESFMRGPLSERIWEKNSCINFANTNFIVLLNNFILINSVIFLYFKFHFIGFILLISISKFIPVLYVYMYMYTYGCMGMYRESAQKERAHDKSKASEGIPWHLIWCKESWHIGTSK